jgi:hypothetical protein
MRSGGAMSKEKWAVIVWLRRRGVTYVRGCDIIEDHTPTLTSPQQL